MYKHKPLIAAILTIFAFILLHDALIAGMANFMTFFRKDNRLDLYESAYKSKIEDLERILASYEDAQNGFKIYDGESYVLGKIAIRNIYDIYDYLIINTKSKVNEGDVVMNEKGLVGVIEEANKTTAKVSLLTKGEKISVKIGDVYGILSEYDKEQREFVIHNIDNYKLVEEGAEVVTSGFQNMRKGLKIGTVSSVDIKGVENVVRVKPFVDFTDLNYLLVLAR